MTDLDLRTGTYRPGGAVKTPAPSNRMAGIRVIPVTALGHAADCRICAAVDSWVANRKRPTPRRGGESPDLAGVAFGAPAASRDAEPRRSSGSPDRPSPEARPG